MKDSLSSRILVDRLAKRAKWLLAVGKVEYNPDASVNKRYGDLPAEANLAGLMALAAESLGFAPSAEAYLNPNNEEEVRLGPDLGFGPGKCKLLYDVEGMYFGSYNLYQLFPTQQSWVSHVLEQLPAYLGI